MNLYEISEFKGLNQSAGGELSLKKGESMSMDNFRIENGKLVTRDGYTALFSLGNFTRLQGIVCGALPLEDPKIYFAADDILYDFDIATGTKAAIATLDNIYESARFHLFFWSDSLYIITGTQYYKYNQSGLQIVTGYIPTLRTGVAPAGTGGTAVSDRNLLNSKAIMEFLGDGSSTLYRIFDGSITVSRISVNGTQTTAYTVNTSAGTVTFTTAPAAGAKVVVEFSMTAFLKRNLVTGCTCGSVFGGQTDSSVFLWGNPGLAYLRVNSYPGNPEYFPEGGQYFIGSRQHAITDIITYYDRQIIFTEKGIYYSTVSESSGNVSYPVYPLNSSFGCALPGGAVSAGNKPIFVDGGVFELTSTSIRDERNVEDIGDRIRKAAGQLDGAVTGEFRARNEYYLSVGDATYVYNYKDAVWYCFSGFTPQKYLEIEGELYFVTTSNVLCRFADGQPYDRKTPGSTEKTPVSAFWEMPFYDFGDSVSYKYTDRIYLSLLPKDKTCLSVSVTNDKGEDCGEDTAENFIFDFSTADFGCFSFVPSLRTKPFVLKLKSRKYSFMKLKLSCNSAETGCTVLSVSIPANITGKIR